MRRAERQGGGRLPGHRGRDLLIGGGVAANRRLRTLLAERTAAHGIALRTPRPALCTDNGAMIAVLGRRDRHGGWSAVRRSTSARTPSLPVETVLV